MAKKATATKKTNKADLTARNENHLKSELATLKTAINKKFEKMEQRIHELEEGQIALRARL